MIPPALIAALISLQSASGAECVYQAMPPELRVSIGDELAAQRAPRAADTDRLVKLIEACAPAGGWSLQGAEHASGYAAFRSGADRVAAGLGNPAWVGIALGILQSRSDAQVAKLSASNVDIGEFKSLAREMITTDQRVATSLNGADDAVLVRFIAMVKFIAIAESERRRSL